MGTVGNIITAFTPFESFRGEYRAIKGVGEQYRIENLNITGGENVGLFRENHGLIHGLSLAGATVSGTSGGILAGTNYGTIALASVEHIDNGPPPTRSTLNVTGDYAGGLVGVNAYGAVIRDSVLRVSDISGGATTDTGGIAGRNSGLIERSGVELRNGLDPAVRTRVEGGGSVGGIAGVNNTGAEIVDVYFLSTLRTTFEVSPGIHEDIFPVSEHGGGIIGNNLGTLSHAVYLAPAPKSGTTIYPMIRNGNPPTDSVFLAGQRYDNNVTLNSAVNLTHSLYNLPDTGASYIVFGGSVIIDGVERGTQGLVTSFLDKAWLEMEGASFSNWMHVSGYPYPVLRSLPHPVNWPEADAPTKDDNVEDPDWWAPIDHIDRATAFPVDFINGDFNQPLSLTRTPPMMPPNFYNNSSDGLGWTINRRSGATPQSGITPASVNPPRRPPATTGWGTGWHPAYIANDTNNNTAGFWTYYHHEWVQGWLVRPVNPAHFNLTSSRGHIEWMAFEFQRPNPQQRDGRAPVTFNGLQGTGTNRTAYAELNPEVQSTLYQIADTSQQQGQSVYYSFYHLTRHESGTLNTTIGDRMSFYLSRIPEGGGHSDGHSPVFHGGFDNLTLIRPCWSPRHVSSRDISVTASSATIRGNFNNYNSAAWNNVAYRRPGTCAASLNCTVDICRDARVGQNNNTFIPCTYVGSLQTYWGPRPEFAGANWGAGQKPFVYDVWIGERRADTSTLTTNRSGYGITFWSNNRINALETATTTYLTIDSLVSAVTNAQLGLPGTATAAQRRAEIERRTFGYWGVENGWKHYYGLYTVPMGQTLTEFAFQSNSGVGTSGNYLAGISFKAPAFLTISKQIRHQSGADAVFADPGEILNVTLEVRNRGEVRADNIVIFDTLDPYNAYFDFVPGSITVRKNNAAITPLSANYGNFNDGGVIRPDTVAVNLSNSFLDFGEIFTVTFQIQVRSTVRGSTDSTLFYYFRNRAFVDYHEDSNNAERRTAFSNNSARPRNGSARNLQVNIDPIRLTKTVETFNRCGTFPGCGHAANIPLNNPGGSPVYCPVIGVSDPLIDGPFKVTLSIQSNTPGADAKGIIIDTIPRGFTVSRLSMNGQAYPFVREPNPDGSSRIILRNVNIAGVAVREFVYELRYEGNGYGVSLNTQAEYRYMYNNSIAVTARFSPQVVGISIKTQPDIFDASGPSTHNILFNDHFITRMSEHDYEVNPTVVLTKCAITGIAAVERDIGWEIDTPNYRVLLNLANNIEFTPKTSETSVFQFYYQINLTATKSGGIPPQFVLDSVETLVTINFFEGNEVLVYYERYDDNSYGFHSLEGGLPPLDNTKTISASGYGILSEHNNRRIQLGDDIATRSSAWTAVGALHLYTIGTIASPVVSADFNLIEIRFQNAGGAFTPRGKIHPNFAKAVYSRTETNAGTQFAIRTPQQMRNISLVADTPGINYNLERNLDFNLVTLSTGGAPNEAVVRGAFHGIFNGGGRTISNVTINAPLLENVGLFSINNGTINGIQLTNSSFTGRGDAVGGIVGSGTPAVSSTETGVTVISICVDCDEYPCECPCPDCGEDPCECPCPDCGEEPCECP
jgi:uncharacterized repeat protein (TIGR01451 family)